MTYKIVYDATQNGSAWGWLAFLVLFVLVMAVIVVAMRFPPPWGPGGRTRAVFDWLGLVLAVSVAFFGLARTLINYREAAAKLRDGNYAVVEGSVTDFVRLPTGGPGQKAESFVVDGRQFSYSGYNITEAGFHQLASRGGPIYEGLRVRIAYSGSEILRLEIAQ